MEIDIRKQVKQEITRIRVADDNGSQTGANVIQNLDGQVAIVDAVASTCDELVIFDIFHANDLIAGIQKAIDLGWFDE